MAAKRVDGRVEKVREPFHDNGMRSLTKKKKRSGLGLSCAIAEVELLKRREGEGMWVSIMEKGGGQPTPTKPPPATTSPGETPTQNVGPHPQDNPPPPPNHTTSPHKHPFRDFHMFWIKNQGETKLSQGTKRQRKSRRLLTASSECRNGSRDQLGIGIVEKKGRH